MALKEKIKIKGMAHITGGGITGNLPRILPKGICANIKAVTWPVHPIFRLIKEMGNVPDEDMKKTFNMGIGYVIVLTANKAKDTISILNKSGYNAFIIGSTEKGGRGVRYS
ncbi:MAG: hypothetical protein A2Y66_08850 [Nitrospirae bacterium RBG_13_41_22]|nr:MAG: hypothetical protein A2Y66_08850 [Nitrospirae bacterium RBG_13_41_22]